jgi:hypothetical protein
MQKLKTGTTTAQQVASSLAAYASVGLLLSTVRLLHSVAKAACNRLKQANAACTVLRLRTF